MVSKSVITTKKLRSCLKAMEPVVNTALILVETRRKERGVAATNMHFQKPTKDDLEACDMTVKLSYTDSAHDSHNYIKGDDNPRSHKETDCGKEIQAKGRVVPSRIVVPPIALQPPPL